MQVCVVPSVDTPRIASHAAECAIHNQPGHQLGRTSAARCSAAQGPSKALLSVHRSQFMVTRSLNFQSCSLFVQWRRFTVLARELSQRVS